MTQAERLARFMGMRLGSQIQALMRRRGIDGYQLAARLGLSHRQLYGRLRQPADLDLAFLIRVAQALDARVVTNLQGGAG